MLSSLCPFIVQLVIVIAYKSPSEYKNLLPVRGRAVAAVWLFVKMLSRHNRGPAHYSTIVLTMPEQAALW